MKFILIRTKEGLNQVDGTLLVMDENITKFICKTIENNSTIFPPGKYKIKWEYSSKFQTNLWELKGITGRSEIKIHKGNKWSMSLGCILITKQNLDILHEITKKIKVTIIHVLNI